MNDENFEKSGHSVQLPEEGHQTVPHTTESYDDQLGGIYHTPFEHYNPAVA